jgi:cellulose synthase operon protein C
MIGIRATRGLSARIGLLMTVALLATAAGARAQDAGGSSEAARSAYATAAALQNREAWELAAEEWESLIKAHPADPLADKGRYYLAICQLKNDQQDKAAETFRRVIASKADAATVALARWELGRIAFQAAQAKPTPEAYAAASRSLDDFVRHGDGQPQMADALFFLGESLWQSGKRDEAIAAWQRFVREHEKNPRLPEVLYALGVGQAETGKRDEATATLKRFAESFSTHALAPDVAIWRADLAAAGGNSAAVEKILAPVVDGEGSRAADALERLAMARWNRKDWPGAAAAYSRLAERFPDSPRASWAQLSAGIAFAEAHKPDEARIWLGKLATSDAPEAAEAAHRLALLEINAKQPARAAQIAEQALAKLTAGGRKPEAETRRMMARLALDRADALWEVPDGKGRSDAAAAYAQIAKDYPDEPAAKTAGSMAALALLEVGKPKEALAEADRFLKAHAAQGKADATLTDVKAIRAEAILAGGDAAAAAAAYQELITAAAGPPAVAPAQLARWRLRQGVALIATKQWQQAHDVLVAAAAGLTDDSAAEAALLDATALVELKKPAEAAKMLVALDRSQPEWPRRDESLLLLVRAQRETGDKAGALATAERLVAEFPNARNADVAWYRLGQVRQDAGRHDEAIQAFAKARALKPKGSRAAWSLLSSGWCHEAKGRLDDAIKAWTELVDAYPDSTAAVPALLARADVRQRKADFAGGLADAREVIARKTAGQSIDADAIPEAMLVEGLCLSGMKQHAEAAAAFKKLLDAQPDGSGADRAMFEMGAALMLAGRGDDATATFTTFVKRFPESTHAADAWFELGEQAWNAGRYAEAATAYRAAIDRVEAAAKAGKANAAPSAARNAALLEQARHKLAWTFVSRGDHAEAAQAFAEQLARYPDGPLAADAQAMRGESLFKAGKPSEAAAAFQAALVDPKRLPSAELRGLAVVRGAEALASQEKWAESLAMADRFVAAEPTSPQAPQARYAAAWARQNLGRLDEALAGYRAVADAARTEIAARARLMEGEVLFEQGNHKEAIKAFFKVAYGFGEKQAPAAFHPWQAQATFEAARCFEVLEQPDKARGLYAELVERYPDSPQTPAAKKRLDSLGGSPK